MGLPLQTKLLSADGKSLLVGGKLKVYLPADPAAGAELTVQPPASNKAFMPLTLKTTFTSAAAVANRGVMLGMDDGASPPVELWRIAHNTVQAASLVRIYNFVQGSNLSQVTGPFDTDKYIGGLPDDLIVEYPWRLRLFTTALQAADQFSATKLIVVEFDMVPTQPV